MADSSAVNEGGILSGDDEVEHTSIAKEEPAKGGKKFKVRIIPLSASLISHSHLSKSVAGVKVEDHPDTPSLRKPSARSGARPNFKDLSRDVTSQFDVFKFYALDALSELDPWVHLPDEKLVEIWNKYSDSSNQMSNNAKADETKYDLFIKVKRLVCKFLS